MPNVTVSTISINDLNLETVDISDLIKNDFAKWYQKLMPAID